MDNVYCWYYCATHLILLIYQSQWFNVPDLLTQKKTKTLDGLYLSTTYIEDLSGDEI